MVKDIRANQRVTTFFVLDSMKLGITKAQKHFLQIALSDKSGRIKGYVWNDALNISPVLSEGALIKVRGITRFRSDNTLVIDIQRIRMAADDEVDISDFMDIVPGGIDYWHKKLLASVELIRDANCRRLIDSFLNDENFLPVFLTSPAGISIHHTYWGGLAQHTANTMDQTALVADRNPRIIDKDVIMTGGFVHDIGKTREISGGISKGYTTEGKLLGHIAIGLLLVEDHISRIDAFPTDLSIMIKHLILSHHGSPDCGSPVRPATAEAVALHKIEGTDAQLNHIYTHLKNSNPNNEWSTYDKHLGTEIFQTKPQKQPMEEISIWR